MCTSEPRKALKKAAPALPRSLQACLALAALLLSTPCFAHNTFPQQIADQLNMPCVPQCTICHRDNLGGFNTVVEPFGVAMRGVGLTFDPATVTGAVNKLEAAMTDSDGDGTSDILELSAGRDPNGSIDLCSVQAPQYGCGARIAAPLAPDHSGVVAAFIIASVLGASAHRGARRRRRLGRHPGRQPEGPARS